jgi:hypothetical protein
MANVLTSGAVLFAPTRKAKTPFLTRLLGTLMESRQRHADRLVEHYLASHGGKFTDDAEREIERLLFREGGTR